jgi:hypothetical protein
MTLALEAGPKYQKTSLEENFKLSYDGLTHGLEMRLFAGTMIRNAPAKPFYSFAPSGRSGPEQYLYQGLYPDRFTSFPKSFFSREMTLSEGGLASPVNDSLGYSRWLLSWSVNTTLPGKASIIPVKPFLNVLLNDHSVSTSKPSLFVEAGLKAGIWNFFEVYFPLIVSDNIKSINPGIKERIRFILRIDDLNPLRSKLRL